MNITQKYNLNFYNRKILNCTLFVFQSINEVMTAYICEWQSSVDVMGAITATNDVINQTKAPIIHTNEGYYTIYTNPQITSFYESVNYNLITPDYSIPTTDFIQILMLWNNFLISNKAY